MKQQRVTANESSKHKAWDVLMVSTCIVVIIQAAKALVMTENQYNSVKLTVLLCFVLLAYYLPVKTYRVFNFNDDRRDDQ